MYNLGETFSGMEVNPGTNLLVAGPPMTGKRRLTFDVLAHGDDSGTIIVTTKNTGKQVLSEYESRRTDGDAPIGIVDCVSKQQGMNPGRVDGIEFASSPVDMTGIGIKLSELLQRFYDSGVRSNRIAFDSLSTLLMYSNLQTVFRFLHVFTGRVQSAEALGLFVIDSSAHDAKTMSTLRQLFDGEIEIREADDNESEVRIKGIGPTTDWQRL
ncbi:MULTISPECIES: recombinase RecA [unclassified Haladaptatus]|uniref:RAD55 family ATPase n=1 Tax=unclassified Haladaptatus TaxID=2622732 RepID=UPI00209C0403|nr:MULTISPECIES: recombinase RecA [unclassified Haladaptatus]MCO8245939.1 recombinase RecA [Haladaptatus sp. AB643]MCO8254441.1 recombinase RecA [Haladaptatus sp. AB618]